MIPRSKKKEYNDVCESIVIPAGCFIYKVDLDCDEPYILMVHHRDYSKEIKIPVPQALAYFLTTHSCGSKKMQELFESYGKTNVQLKIKDALGLK